MPERSAAPIRSAPSASILIATYNRAALLGQTLDRLAAIRPRLAHWDVVVIDNNSGDDTRAVVASRIAQFPVPLRYVFERAQGRSHALNTGIAVTTAPVLVFTDDDVVVGSEWLDAATAPLLEDSAIEYTGGPVRPIWESPRPAWLSADRADLWGTIAICDYGDGAFVYEERRRVPLGANMAVRRRLFERIGPFDARLGRSNGRQLLGQEVPELLARSRAAGARGLYVPSMMVDHHVPSQRLTKAYFRRWWYGKGVSRARLDSLRPLTELDLDLTRVRRFGGLPLFMWRAAACDAAGWITATFDKPERFRHEAMLCYFAGYLGGRRRASGTLQPAVAG
jgi:glucosyl-dolichyl phosphate glucuronosyltransferase